MKNGKTLIELATELQRQSTAKRDLIVPTASLKMTMATSGLQLPDHQGGNEYLSVTDHCHCQIANRIGVPKKYYDKMREDAPQLLAQNVNHWFEAQPENRMIRTLDGKARAFLSDRYHRIDNDQIAEGVLQSFQAAGQPLEIVSTEVTERRLYINARFPTMENAIAVGDPVQMGVTITNSEVGGGALSITPMLYRLVCTNGMVAGSSVDEGKMRRNHLGRKVQASEDFSIYQGDTVAADDRALMLKIRDTIGNLSDPAKFLALCERMRAANRGEEVVRPVKAVEELVQRTTLTQGEGDSILENLLRGDDGLPTNMTKWGMANAVTRLANTIESFDRSQELMELGGKVIDLSTREWSAIAEAA